MTSAGLTSTGLPRRGFLRPRLAPDVKEFTMGGHLFETAYTDVWFTPAGTPRIDRIKITRHFSSTSVRRGWPAELIRPRSTSEPIALEEARRIAEYWITWWETPDAAKFPPIQLDRWAREEELASR